MSPASLSAHQRQFTRYIGIFIGKVYATPGQELTFGEVWRSEEQQAIYLRTGKSWIKRSNHQDRLAVDFNLFINGVYQTSTEAWRALGTVWESLHPNCRWGGRFRDGNHVEWSPGWRNQ